MKLVGFNFSKISIEKLKDSFKEVKLNTKIDVSSIIEAKNTLLKGDDQILAVKFSYIIGYDPGVAKIILEGNVLLATDKKQAKEVLSEWKKKKMSEDFRVGLFNLILRKSNIKALQLEDEMGLPLHIPFPTLKKPESKE